MDLMIAGDAVVVTGAASGIGLETARRLLAEGCRVDLWDQAETIFATVDELLRRYPDAVAATQVDLRDEAATRQAANAANARWNGFRHVVHCAAIGSGRFGFPFTNLRPEEWRRVLDVNIMGTVHVVHACEPIVRAAAPGSIVLLGSIAAQIGSQTDPPYSASKAAILNFMQCAAKDLAPAGVRVNMVNPGMVETPLNKSVWQAWFDQQPPAARLDYQTWAARKMQNIVPQGTWQSASDVAALIAFLCSPHAKSITGQTLNVDGGCVMHW